MKQPEWLDCPVINRHASHKKVRADFRKLDAAMLHHGVPTGAIEKLEGYIGRENSFGHCLPRKKFV
jgi:hypothetical protein